MTEKPIDSKEAALDNLQLELLRLRSLDQRSQERVDALTAKINELRAQPETERDYQTASTDLSDSLASFEASHPHATEIIDRIMLLLSSIGI
jgi:hypothetical protein